MRSGGIRERIKQTATNNRNLDKNVRYNTRMNKDEFLSEVENRLSKMFAASKEGYKVAPIDRHRLEGFMQAGVFIGLVSNAELSELMEAVHMNVYGQTIAERRAACSTGWQNESIDYSQYDQPAYVRRNN